METSHEATSVSPQIDASNPASMLILLEMSDINPADTYVQFQPHVDAKGRLGVVSSLRDVDDDALIVRHFCVLQEKEEYDAGVARVKAAFDGAGLSHSEEIKEALPRLTADFPKPVSAWQPEIPEPASTTRH